MKRTIPILFAVLALAAACSQKDPTGDPERAAEQQVEITLREARSARTRAPIAEETVVGELDLLVFKDDAFRYWRSAYRLGGKFRATLTVDTGLDVYFLANARALVTELDAGGRMSPGMSWESLRTELVDDDPSKFNYTSVGQIRLPMWGVLKGKDVEDVPLNHWGTLDLLRSVASVDVEVGSEVTDETFKLEDLRLFFVPDKGLPAPSSLNLSGEGLQLTVTVPESPQGMQTTLTLLSTAYDAPSKSIANRLYLYENDTSQSDRTLLPDQTRRYTRVVIGGLYLGTKYYYPIDFETDHDTPDPIVRNRKYLFRINSVSSRGYADPQTAAEEPAVGLDVSIVRWDEKTESDFYTSGPYYVGITGGREVVLQRQAGSERVVALRSNVKAALIGLGFGSDSVNGEVQTVTGGIRNDRFRVVATADAGGSVTGLVFTALRDYDADDDTHNHDVLTVTSGRIRFEITISQVGRSDNDWEDGGGEEVDVQ